MLSSACRSARSEMPKPTVYKSCETGYNTGFGEAAGKVAEELRRRKDAPSAEEMAKIQQEEEAKAAQVAAAEEAREAAEKKAAEEAKASAEAAQAAAEKATEKEPEPEPEPEAKVEAVPDSERAAKDAPKPSKGKLRGEKKAPEPEREPEPDKHVKAAAPKAADAGEEAPVIATLPVTVDEKEILLTLHEGVNAQDAVADFCAKHMPGVAACSGQLLPHVLSKLEESGVAAE